MFLILRTSLRLAYTLAEGALRVSRWKKKLNRRFNRNDRKKEGAEPMKKSCLIRCYCCSGRCGRCFGRCGRLSAPP